MFQSRGEKDRCKAVKNQGGAGIPNTSSPVFLLKQQGREVPTFKPGAGKGDYRCRRREAWGFGGGRRESDRLLSENKAK